MISPTIEDEEEGDYYIRAWPIFGGIQYITSYYTNRNSMFTFLAVEPSGQRTFSKITAIFYQVADSQIR